MAGVGSWDPAKHVTVDASAVSRLCLADDEIEAPNLGFTPEEIARYAPLMRLPPERWSEVAQTLSVTQIESLIRVLTVGEMKLPGWEAKAKSPVIPLVTELKRRNAHRKELNAWIKAHTTNRFLPYGSLMDRL
jgi:hypothetical protein